MGAGAASGAARTASVLVAMESSMKTTPLAGEGLEAVGGLGEGP